MVRDELVKIIKESLAIILDRPVAPLSLDASLSKDLGLESIEILDLFVEIEQRLGRPIDLIELIRNRSSSTNYSKNISIRDIVEFIERTEAT